MKTKVYYASTDPILRDFDAYIDRLPENLKGRILKKSDLNAKVCSLGGALLLNIAAKESGVDVSKVVYTPEGKPYIPESDFCFSISHTKGYAAISFGKVPSGCDIQIKKDVNMKIAKRFFSVKENEVVSDVNDFFKIWCRKESVYKIQGKNCCTEINDENYIYRDFEPEDDLQFCVCAEEGEILKPAKIELDTVF